MNLCLLHATCVLSVYVGAINSVGQSYSNWFFSFSKFIFKFKFETEHHTLQFIIFFWSFIILFFEANIFSSWSFSSFFSLINSIIILFMWSASVVQPQFLCSCVHLSSTEDKPHTIQSQDDVMMGLWLNNVNWSYMHVSGSTKEARWVCVFNWITRNARSRWDGEEIRQRCA